MTFTMKTSKNAALKYSFSCEYKPDGLQKVIYLPDLLQNIKHAHPLNIILQTSVLVLSPYHIYIYPLLLSAS
jgi:hypothetical protein